MILKSIHATRCVKEQHKQKKRRSFWNQLQILKAAKPVFWLYLELWRSAMSCPLRFFSHMCVLFNLELYNSLSLQLYGVTWERWKIFSLVQEHCNFKASLLCSSDWNVIIMWPQQDTWERSFSPKQPHKFLSSF